MQFAVSLIFRITPFEIREDCVNDLGTAWITFLDNFPNTGHLLFKTTTTKKTLVSNLLWPSSHPWEFTDRGIKRAILFVCLFRGTQNSTHLLIQTPLNGCGTQVNETEDALIFWNEIQVDAVVIDYVITRTHDIRLPFYCSYSRRKMLRISFKPRNVYFGEEGNVVSKHFFTPICF